jgi:outer membrane protein TolC
MYKALLLLALSFCSTSLAATSQLSPLTLPIAEQLATTAEPSLQRLQANTQALQQQAIADGQWSDPQVSVGAANVPSNTLSMRQDDMTMVEVGVQQTFPKGRSLTIKSKQTQVLSQAEQIRLTEQTLMLLRNVRNTWLELYYWTHSAQVLKANKTRLQRVTKSSESQYSAGKINQTDLMQAELELTRLEDKLAQTQETIALLRAQLGRWIGHTHSERPLTTQLPPWPALPPLSTLQANILKHPLLKVDAAKIDAGRAEVAWAKEQFKPGVAVGVGYGMRQGRMQDGQRRSDFVGAQMTIDLPVATSQRQDRRLKASTSQLLATELDRQVNYRDLMSTLIGQYAVWQRLTEREALFKKRLVPEARQNAKAALLAYQNASSDLPAILRAHNTLLDTELDQLRVQVDLAKARVALLYLEGTAS